MDKELAIIIEVKGDKVAVHLVENLDFIKNLHFLHRLKTKMEKTINGAQKMFFEDIILGVHDHLVPF